MPTRFYFDDTVYWNGGTSNPADPAYSASWHETNVSLRLKLSTSKNTVNWSDNTIQKNVAGAPKYGLMRVYVSDPFPKAFTLSGKVRGQFMANEQGAGNDACRAVIIRVASGDCKAFRLPVVLSHLPAAVVSEFSAVGAQNRNFPPETLINPVAVQVGDRLVVEVGAAYFTTSSGVGTTVLLRSGCKVGSDDLPVDESYTLPEASPWIEFEQDFPGVVTVSPKMVTLGTKVGPLVGLDYSFELVSPDGDIYDVTERVSMEGLSKLTLTVERNLHEFRAGDLSLTFDDGDGFFSALWEAIVPADLWRLNANREGVRHFSGVIPGIDSIRFDRKQQTVEVTVLDLSKLLEDISSETVGRNPDAYALTVDAAVSATVLTVNGTADLYNGDTLNLSTELTTEDVTIARVLTTTTIQITNPLSNAFVALDTVVVLTSPYYRSKTPDFLINALLDAAGDRISGRSIRLQTTSTVHAVPLFSDMNAGRLPETNVPKAWLQKNAKNFLYFGTGGTSWEQVNPEDDWTSVSPARNWIDWSPYRTQAEGEPGTFATVPSGIDPDNIGIDLTPGAFVAWGVEKTTLAKLNKWTSADGLSWSSKTLVANLGDGVTHDIDFIGADYDPIRNRVYYFWWSTGAGTQEFGYWDVSAATKVVLDSADQRSGTIRYSKEADAVLVYNDTQNRVEMWRDVSVVKTYAGAYAGDFGRGLRWSRYLDGAWYCLAYPLNLPTILYSADDLDTVTAIVLDNAPVTGATTRRLTIVNGTIRIACNCMPTGATSPQCRYFVGSSGVGSFAGVIPYANFEGQSLINSLDDLAILLNAVFYVDTQAVAHFVHRELDSGVPLKLLDDLVLEREEEPIWLEFYDYCEFKLEDGTVGSAGQKTSASRNLTVDIQLTTSYSVATAAAIYLLSFYGKKRRHNKVDVEDDGTVYALLDPIRLDGVDWLVYSVERDLATWEVTLELLENVS